MGCVARQLKYEPECSRNKHHTRAAKAQKWQGDAGQRDKADHRSDVQNNMRAEPAKDPGDREPHRHILEPVSDPQDA